MGKTIRKIGRKNGKHKVPVIEGTAYAKAHNIRIPYNCRCEICTSERKRKILPKLIEKDQLDELNETLPL